jgi:superfamily II DNA or RNA helicase
VPAISALKFPFMLKKDQLEAIDAWLKNGLRGSIIYSTGTGKTEIAFECARRAADMLGSDAFKVLFLVPRIVLIEQNVKRLLKYGLGEEVVGVYYGERKDAKEITISTYQSVISNYQLIRNANMVVLDEIHLLSETATEFDKIFDVILEDPKKAILGLTATLNEKDGKYSTIMVVAPPIRKYMIKDAVIDGRLAKPVIIPKAVRFTSYEQTVYEETSSKIKEISARLKVHDPITISKILMNGGPRSFLAKSWFANVRRRREILSTTSQKFIQVLNIVKEHPNERIMIFSETIESIEKLKKILKENDIHAETMHNQLRAKERKLILEEWGKEYFPLLSVHTLEIGYDIPQAGIAIIISSTSNINQIVQRIGRVIRKFEGKNRALIYVVYVNDTKDDNILKLVKEAIEKKGYTNVESFQEKTILSYLNTDINE